MNQSTAIFGAIFIAYFVFITIRGELPIYAGFLLSTPQAPGNTQTSGITASNISSAAITALSLA